MIGEDICRCKLCGSRSVVQSQWYANYLIQRHDERLCWNCSVWRVRLGLSFGKSKYAGRDGADEFVRKHYYYRSHAQDRPYYRWTVQ